MKGLKTASRDIQLSSPVLQKRGGGAIKSSLAHPAKEGWIEGYLVSWGNPNDTDLQGEYFTPHTEYCLNWFPTLPVLYHHGMDSGTGLRKIGEIKSIKNDHMGLWVQAQLDLNDEYAATVYQMIKKQDFGWSSGSVDHLVKIAQNGEIKTWPIIEGSVTPTPAQPAKTTIRSMSVKSLINNGDLSEDYKKNLVGLMDGRIAVKSHPRDNLYKDFIGDSMHTKRSYRSDDDYELSVAQMRRAREARAMRQMEDEDMDEFDSPVASRNRKQLANEIEKAKSRIRARAAQRQAEFAIEEDIRDTALAARRARNRRQMEAPVDEETVEAAIARRRAARRQMAAPEAETPSAVVAAYEKGRRAAMRQMETQPPVPPTPVASYGRSDVMAQDDLGLESAVARRRAARRQMDPSVSEFPEGAAKSMSAVEAWKARAQGRVPQMSNATKTNFSRLDVTRAEGDSPLDYSRLFVKVLRFGETKLSEIERNILNKHGSKVGHGEKYYDSATKSIKTFFGGSDASLGYAVPPHWVSELQKNLFVETVMLKEVGIKKTTSDTLVQPKLQVTDARMNYPGGVRWVGEQPNPVTESEVQEQPLTQIQIPVHLFMATHIATLTALEDVSYNLEAEIMNSFTEKMKVMYDTLIFAGDGQGKPRGIVVDPLVIGRPSLGVQTPSGYIASGDATSIINADVIKTMFMHLPSGYRSTAKWYMNSNTLGVIMRLKDGNGNYLVDTRYDPITNVGAPARLMDRPVIVNDFAPDIAPNAFPVIFGDLQKGYLLAERVDFSVRRFDDFSNAINDQVSFVGRGRVGGQVVQEAAIKVLRISVN
jgi:HK97 family phage major capsid protein